jgi:hypothetical protein
MSNKLPSEIAAVCGTIDPDAYTAGAYTSDYISMANFQRGLAIIMAGALGTNATLDAKLVQATDASGTGVKDISGKAITQLTEAGTDSDKQALINFEQTDLDTAGGFAFVAIIMTVATATSDAGALLMGFDARNEPASASDLASVDEIVQ